MAQDEAKGEEAATGQAARRLVSMEREQMWHHYGKYPYLLAKFAFFGAILVLIYLVLSTVGGVLFPIFVALLLAYLFDPMIDRFEERGVSRAVGIVLLLGALLVAATIFGAFLYPLIAKQVIMVVEKFPGLVDRLQHEFLPWAQEQLQVEVPPTLAEATQHYGGEIKAAAPAVLKKLGGWATGLLSSSGMVFSSLLNLVMIPIFLFYFLLDFDHGKEALGDLIPLWAREGMLSRLERVDDVVGAWFRGQLQVALILAILYAIGLAICFGVAGLSVFDGVALGVISGALCLVPYLGFIIGFGLSLLLVLINWQGIGALIGVLAVFGVVQTLESYLITPKIVGEKVGLSPVAVIIVLLLGGEVGGLLGIVLAIPVAASFKVVLPDLIDAYKRSPYFHGKINVWSGDAIVIQAPSAEVAGDTSALDEAPASEPSVEEDEADAQASSPSVEGEEAGEEEERKGE